MSEDLLQKVIDTTRIGAGGGLLPPDQTNRFIDYMWDSTVLLKTARFQRIRGTTAEVNHMALGQRLARHATEGIDDHVPVSPTFSKVSISTEKIRLDWELTTESLEDNIEGDDLEDHVARLMATALANDLEDLAINGDVDIAPGSDGYALLKAFDGFRRLGLDNGHVIDMAGAEISRAVFNRLFKALPRQWKQRRDELRFWVSSNLVQDYYYWLSLQTFDIAEAQLVRGNPGIVPSAKGVTGLSPFGIPIIEVPYQEEDLAGDYVDAGGENPDPTEEDHGYIELTHPSNRIWVMKREIKVYREFKPKKDAIEYTVFTRQGVAMDNPDAYVVAKNVKQRAE